MEYAPIVLFVYNRAKHTKEVLTKLSENELAKDSELFIYSDGPKRESDIEKIKEVRNVLKEIKGFKKVTITASEKNKGLANSVIGGVTEVINKYGKVIVLEDDLLTQKYFLNVMNQMLDYYSNDKKIGSVTAFMITTRQVKVPKYYIEDIFFNVRPCSTGWGTWKDRWDEVDWEVQDYLSFSENKYAQKQFNKGGKDLTKMLKAQIEGKIDSWAIRWSYHQFKKGLVCVQTTKSYVDNIGYDSSGIHSKDESLLFRQESLASKKRLDLYKYSGVPTWEIIKRYRAVNSFGWVYIKKKLYSKIGILIKI
ncbi:MAG: sugar transferase [Candidatus Dojkabacteria bacterium]